MLQTPPHDPNKFTIPWPGRDWISADSPVTRDWRILCKLCRPAHAYAPNHDRTCALSQPSKHACTVSVMKRYRLPVLTSTVTVPACQYTVPKQYRYSTETGLRAHWACIGTVPQQYSSGIKMVPFLYWWCRFTVVVVQKLCNFWTDFTWCGTDVTKTVPFLYWWYRDAVPMVQKQYCFCTVKLSNRYCFHIECQYS